MINLTFIISANQSQSRFGISFLYLHPESTYDYSKNFIIRPLKIITQNIISVILVSCFKRIFVVVCHFQEFAKGAAGRQNGSRWIYFINQKSRQEANLLCTYVG